MFDNLVAARGPATGSRRRLRKVVIAVSLAAHVVVAGAVLVTAWWRVDRLPFDHSKPVLAAFVAPGDRGGGTPRREPLRPRASRHEVKVVVRDPVQPQPRVKPDPAPVAVATTDPGDVGDTGQGGGGDGDGDGSPGTGGGGDGTGTATPTPTGSGCTEPPCGGGDARLEPRPNQETPVTITEKDADALKISGNEQIHAPNTVRTQMMRAGKDRTLGVVKLCVGTDGRVATAKLLKSTGYDAYDAKLVDEMRQWRYEPLVRAGTAKPFCAAITLVYVMKR
jgi:TonB family protein